MKKLFFTIAVCLLTTLSFAEDQGAYEFVSSDLELVSITVRCNDGHEWNYTGYISKESFIPMIDELLSGCQ